jgi:tetratricopeptide (TPR) repeat protein
VEESVQAAFGMTADQFDKALRDYLASGKYRYYPVPTPSGIVSSQFTVAEVSAANARAVVADIHAHSPDYRDKALGEFQDVLKTDPDNAAALRGAGFVCMEQKDYAHAEEYLRRAAERDKKDPRVHFYYALLLNRQASAEFPRAAEIKKELEASIALDPNMADAYSLLGFEQSMSGEAAKGIASLNKALELSPRNENYMLNLASAYVAAERVDTAIGILRNLTGSLNPEIAARARKGLEQATQVKEQTGRLEFRVDKDTEGRADGDAKAESTSGLKTVVVLPAMHYIKGRVVAVDCSASPDAVLTLAAGEKSLRMHVADRAHAVVIGADEFSCDWAGKILAVNYHERADGDGEVVSVELQ